MAPSPTVKSVRDAELARVLALSAALQAELATADSDLAIVRAQLAAATDLVAATQAAEADLRLGLAAALMPAEAHQLELDLEANLLLQRPQLAALAAAQDGLAVLERTRQRTAASLDRTRAQLAQAAADVVVGDREDADASMWRLALGGPVLAAMVAEADSTEVGDQVTAARNRLAALLGQADLVELLERRLTDADGAAGDRGAAVVRAIDALDTLRTELSPLDGAAVQAGDRFARARDEARSVVERGPQRLAAARGVLQLTAGAAGHTSAEQDRINSRAADVVNGSSSPADRQIAVLDASVALRVALAAFEAKALVEQAKDPDFDPEADQALEGERIARDDARTAFDKATGDFTDADKAAIDTWEVAIPPATMLLAVDALRAAAAIEELKDLKLIGNASLLERLDATEQTYAEALEAQLAATVRQQEAAALVAERLDLDAAMAPVALLRVAALVRGDQ